jgi:hypothetical protein
MVLSFDLGSGANFRAPTGSWVSGNFVGGNGGRQIAGAPGVEFMITGVKLEIGSVATPFNQQSLAKSMIDCQRYYNSAPANTLWMYAYVSGAGQSFGQSWLFPVAMRATPTIAFNNIIYANANTMTLNVANSSGLSAYASATAATACSFSCGFTASAEL